MPTQVQRVHFVRRAAEVRRQAAAAGDPDIREVLEAMAQSCGQLIEKVDRLGPMRSSLDKLIGTQLGFYRANACKYVFGGCQPSPAMFASGLDTFGYDYLAASRSRASARSASSIAAKSELKQGASSTGYHRSNRWPNLLKSPSVKRPTATILGCRLAISR